MGCFNILFAVYAAGYGGMAGWFIYEIVKFSQLEVKSWQTILSVVFVILFLLTCVSRCVSGIFIMCRSVKRSNPGRFKGFMCRCISHVIGDAIFGAIVIGVNWWVWHDLQPIENPRNHLEELQRLAVEKLKEQSWDRLVRSAAIFGAMVLLGIYGVIIAACANKAAKERQRNDKGGAKGHGDPSIIIVNQPTTAVPGHGYGAASPHGAQVNV